MPRNPNTKLFDEVEDLEREEEEELLDDEDEEYYTDEDEYYDEEDEDEFDTSTAGGDLLSEFDNSF